MEVRDESPPVKKIVKMGIKEALSHIWKLFLQYGSKYAMAALRRLGIASGWCGIILFIVTTFLESKFKLFVNQLVDDQATQTA